MAGADDMDRQIDQWTAKVHAKAEKFRAMASEMGSITGHAESSSGVVRVTVDRTGVVTKLDIADDIRGMRGGQLASEILSTIKTAQSGLGEQVVALMQEHVPDETASIASVSDAYAKQFVQPDADEEPQASTTTPSRSPDDDDDGDINMSVFQ